MVLTNLNMKRQNLSVGDNFLVDRISNLPDAVISHILSFLPTTKEVVATSILAKQWRYMWTLVDKFDFQDKIYGVSVVKVRKYFKPFVYRVLKLHQGNIKELRHSCSNRGCKELDVTNWINTVTARGVERLVLSTQLTCPLSIFTCETLIDLKMDSYDISNMNIPSAPFFPCLRKLHIEYLKYDTESLKHFILRCSALEHFVIRCNINRKVNTIEIVSSTLKRLELCSSYYGFDEKLHLSVPSLEHLKIWYLSPPELSMEEHLAFLVEADINLCDPFLFNVCANQLRETFVRFIHHFANVKVLRLNCHLMKFLTSVGHAQFPNLTKLEIQSSYFEWRLLVSFMESSINLEAITLRKMSKFKKHKLAWKEPKNVPLSLSSSLKKITIKEYSEDELPMVKYALKTAEVLERMDIQCSVSYKDMNEVKSGMMQRIEKLPRASKRCIFSLV